MTIQMLIMILRLKKIKKKIIVTLSTTEAKYASLTEDVKTRYNNFKKNYI